MKAIGAFTALVACVLISSFISAFVGITLYHWFMLPVGAPDLSTGQLYGVLYFISYVCFCSTDVKEDDRELSDKLIAMIGKALGYGALFLGMGWATKAIIY